jgi:uncharacterized protein (TIGR02145 family)
MTKKFEKIIDKTMLLLILAVTAIASSCVSESELSKDSQEDIALKINMQVPSQTNVSTRTTTLSSNESTVNDLTVLIFNSSNQLIGYGYSASPTSTGTNTYQMTVNTREAKSCMIYVVANAGANAFAGVNTVDEFKKLSVTLNAASDLGAQSNTIMQGVSSTGQDITSSTETLATTIPLYRLCTKMNFNIIPANNITITGYQLHEVPVSSYIANRSTEATPLYNPSGTYKDFDAVTENSPTAGNEVTDTYYIYENLAGTVANSNTAKARNSTNAPATASYLDVYATGTNWKSTYRIYLGGTGTTDYTNYNIPRNYNYTYTINITGSGIYDVRVTCYPELINSSTGGTWGSNGSAATVTSSATANVGDYYFSDGTWGSLANNPGKTPIAVVFSGTTSTTDQGHGWTHGYAMALTNASAGCQWSANTTTYPSITTTDESVLTNYTGDYTTFITNKDGYTETQAIKNAYLSSLQNDHPAFWYALNYNVIAPIGSSGWYLPSVGQWWDIETKLGDISTIPESSPGNCYWYNSNNSTHYSTISVKNVNKYLTSIDNYITPDYFDDNTNYYWSSSEYNSNNSYHSSFQIGGADMDLNNGQKNCLILIRSAIAF